MFNGQTPNYLLNTFPLNVNAKTHYTLRNAVDIDLITRNKIICQFFYSICYKTVE